MSKAIWISTQLEKWNKIELTAWAFWYKTEKKSCILTGNPLYYHNFYVREYLHVVYLRNYTILICSECYKKQALVNSRQIKFIFERWFILQEDVNFPNKLHFCNTCKLKWLPTETSVLWTQERENPSLTISAIFIQKIGCLKIFFRDSPR